MTAPGPLTEGSPDAGAGAAGAAAVAAVAAAPIPALPATSRPLKAFFRRLRRQPWFQVPRLWLRRLAGLEPWLRVEVRSGLASVGGWQFRAEGLRPGQVAYCAGIGTNTAFETALARDLGLEVHAFDPTPACRDWLEATAASQGLHYHPWALADRDGSLSLHTRRGRSARARGTMLSVVDDGTGESLAVTARTVTSICRELGHGQLALLKLDIEGAEYPVLRELLAGPCRPDQVLVEFHHRFPGIGARATASTVAALRAVGYRIAAISAEGREVTFLRVAGDPADAGAGRDTGDRA